MPTTPKTSVQKTWICDPRDDRCVRPIEPPFLPGISVRHSPSCYDHLCNTVFQCDFGNWRITNQNTLDRAKWIEGWIMTQLLTKAWVDCDEHPLRDMPGSPIKRGGGWWADAFRSTAVAGAARPFISGSKLWALNWVHGGATNNVLLKAEEYATQALRYLLQWGVVSRISVKAVYLTRAINGTGFPGAVMHLRVSVAGPGIVATTFTFEGSQMPNFEWLWKEYEPPKPIATGGRWYEAVRTQNGRTRSLLPPAAPRHR